MYLILKIQQPQTPGICVTTMEMLNRQGGAPSIEVSPRLMLMSELRPKVLTSKKMHRAAIAYPNPISKAAPMKIAQTVRPGYPLANLWILVKITKTPVKTLNSSKQITHSAPINGLPSCNRYTEFISESGKNEA